MSTPAQKRAYRAKKKAQAQQAATPAVPEVTPAPVQEGALFDVEEAPADVFNNDNALDKVFKALGLKSATPAGKKEEKTLPVARLNKQQQLVFDGFAPLGISAFIALCSWGWKRIGPEYAILAPSEEVAEKIIAPLVRIYARTSRVAASFNANHLDALASFAALFEYIRISFGLYSLIKQEKEAYGESSTLRNSLNGHRQADAHESGYGSQDTGRDDLRGPAAMDSIDIASHGTADGPDLSHLTDMERQSYEKLSRLRQLDYQSRARRSGRGG